MSESFELNGTTWVFNNSLDFSFNDYEELILSAAIKVPFTDSANNNWDGMLFEPPSGSSDPDQTNLIYAVDDGEGSVSDTVLVYDIEDDVWDSSSSKTITFSGEPSTLWGTSESGIYQFYDWLEANATQQTPVQVVNYLATNTDFTSVANAIRTKGRTNTSLSFPSGWISAINNIPTIFSSDAILVVTVQTGSTVTAEKGNTTLTPTIWVQAEDSTLDTALFVIPPAMFDAQNAWTVTATRDTDTASDTVTVDTNKEYSLEILYKLYVFRSGYGFVNDFTTVNAGAFTINDNYLEWTSNKNGFAASPMVDASYYSLLCCELEATSVDTDAYKPTFGLSTNTNVPTSSGSQAAFVVKKMVGKTDRDVFTLDISGYNDSYYFKFTEFYFRGKVYNIWFE